MVLRLPPASAGGLQVKTRSNRAGFSRLLDLLPSGIGALAHQLMAEAQLSRSLLKQAEKAFLAAM